MPIKVLALRNCARVAGGNKEKQDRIPGMLRIHSSGSYGPKIRVVFIPKVFTKTTVMTPNESMVRSFGYSRASLLLLGDA